MEDVVMTEFMSEYNRWLNFADSETKKELESIKQSKKDLCSKNFKKLGVGAYTKHGRTFYWCIFLTD